MYYCIILAPTNICVKLRASPLKTRRYLNSLHFGMLAKVAMWSLKRGMNVALYISGVLIGLSLVLQLGTGNIGLIHTGIKKGFFPALIFSLGCAIGDGLYALLAVLGVAWLLQSSSIFQIIMWIGGTAMLCYLTFQAFKDTLSPKELDLNRSGVEKKSLWAYFFTGFWLVVSSPTGLVWFATVAGSVVSSAIGNAGDQSPFPFILGFVSISVVWGAALAYVSSVGGKIMGNKMVRLFSFISGLLFLYFAIYVFRSGVKNIF